MLFTGGGACDAMFSGDGRQIAACEQRSENVYSNSITFSKVA
jgi:hypothetical protein